MGDARRAARGGAVLQPVRSAFWAAAASTLERAQRPPPAGLSAVSGPALSRPPPSPPRLHPPHRTRAGERSRNAPPRGRARPPLGGGGKPHPSPPPGGPPGGATPPPARPSPRAPPRPADTSPQPGDEVIAEP